MHLLKSLSLVRPSVCKLQFVCARQTAAGTSYWHFDHNAHQLESPSHRGSMFTQKKPSLAVSKYICGYLTKLKHLNKMEGFSSRSEFTILTDPFVSTAGGLVVIPVLGIEVASVIDRKGLARAGSWFMIYYLSNLPSHH